MHLLFFFNGHGQVPKIWTLVYNVYYRFYMFRIKFAHNHSLSMLLERPFWKDRGQLFILDLAFSLFQKEPVWLPNEMI